MNLNKALLIDYSVDPDLYHQQTTSRDLLIKTPSVTLLMLTNLVTFPTLFDRLTYVRANFNRIFKSRNFIFNILHHRFYHTFSFQNHQPDCPDELCELTYVNRQFLMMISA